MKGQGAAGRMWRYGAGLVLLVALVVAAGYYFRVRKPVVSDFDFNDPTLVVLPLRIDEAQHDDDVVAQGLSAELIERLAAIKGLRVTGIASARRAVAEKFDSKQLQQRLGATHSLSGTLRIHAPQAYVELDLVDLASGRIVLKHTYDRAIDETSLLGQDIALDVAKSLQLLIPAMPDTARVAPDAYRTYCEARRLADDRQQRAREIELLRKLVTTAPDFARAHAALARALVGDQRPELLAPGESEELVNEGKRALQLDPNLAEAHVTLALAACRSAEWARCMQLFQRAFELNPSDTYGRMEYAYWLGAMGFVDRALREAEIMWRVDPLSASANFVRGRMLDTVDRHNEATRYLDEAVPPSSGYVYARWHNAVWRGDLDAAAKIAVEIPESDGFREAYLVVSEALIEPRLWSEALPLIRTSERATGSTDVLRLMMPDPDYAVIISGLEGMQRNVWPSYYLLLWMPEYAKLRQHPAFQEFLKRTHLIDHWRATEWPPQCHAQGEVAVCN
jgi:TolB-like protein